MPARQVIGLDGVLDENCSAISANKLRFAVVVLVTEYAIRSFFEIARCRMELLNRETNKFVTLRPKELDCRWVCFETDSPVVKNQNAVECAIEDCGAPEIVNSAVSSNTSSGRRRLRLVNVI